MANKEHRPVIDPSILGRMASSMESIREAWEADVADLLRTKAALGDVELQLAVANERLNDIAQDFKDVRAENVVLIQKNAVAEATLQRFIEASKDAGDHLTSLAVRAELPVKAAPAPASVAVAVTEVVPTPEPEPTIQHSELRARAEAAVRAVGRGGPDEYAPTKVGTEIDDGRTPTTEDLPIFLRHDLGADPRHRTVIAPNEFGRVAHR